jgi:hypothetical protein
MEAFIQKASPETLRQYADIVLKWDAYFAVLFALGIALLSVATLLTCFNPGCTWLKWPLLVACSWVACMALLYGAADVGEDYLLRRIIAQSLPHKIVAPDNPAELGVDMAQVDAANMLTRLKMITLGASFVGAGLWFVLSAVSHTLCRPRPEPKNPDPELRPG